jgi:hypothetical protein
MVRIELCSTRTIGRSARRGILGVVCVVSMLRWVECVVTVRVRYDGVNGGVAEQKNTSVTTGLANTWVDAEYGYVLLGGEGVEWYEAAGWVTFEVEAV